MCQVSNNFVLRKLLRSPVAVILLSIFFVIFHLNIFVKLRSIIGGSHDFRIIFESRQQVFADPCASACMSPQISITQPWSSRLVKHVLYIQINTRNHLVPA